MSAVQASSCEGAGYTTHAVFESLIFRLVDEVKIGHSGAVLVGPLCVVGDESVCSCCSMELCFWQIWAEISPGFAPFVLCSPE